jgi:hypothetical protein
VRVSENNPKVHGEYIRGPSCRTEVLGTKSEKRRSHLPDASSKVERDTGNYGTEGKKRSRRSQPSERRILDPEVHPSPQVFPTQVDGRRVVDRDDQFLRIILRDELRHRTCLNIVRIDRQGMGKNLRLGRA